MKAIPLAVRVMDSPCLCVGGGKVAARRVVLLLEAGAAVTVVAPTLDPALRALVAGGKCEHQARPYAAGDCIGASLVLAATGLPEVDTAVAAEARAQGALVCVASNQALGNCLFMGTVRRGPLVVALHTDGAAPAVSAALRRRFDDLLPEKLGDVLDDLVAIRGTLREAVDDPAERARRWEAVVRSGALDRLVANAEPSDLEDVRDLLLGSRQIGSVEAGERSVAEQTEYT
jgi:siroheme synthase-like protein